MKEEEKAVQAATKMNNQKSTQGVNELSRGEEVGEGSPKKWRVERKTLI